jgi:pimeloyl-ACP methyl ester carboxylesterase
LEADAQEELVTSDGSCRVRVDGPRVATRLAALGLWLTCGLSFGAQDGSSVGPPIPDSARAPSGVEIMPPGDRYWSGQVALAGQAWRIEVASDRQSLWISVPSLWSPWQKPDRSTRDGRVFQFVLPLDIGRAELDLHPDAPEVKGTLRSLKGEIGALRLLRSEPTRFSARAVRVRRDGIVIAGTASAPMKASRRPAVVILHGGGNSSRGDSPPYRFWGEYFAARGYVAFTYDKRGNGESTGDWKKVGFDERADDVLAIVSWLRQQPDVDPDRVGLFAVSQGTWVAGLGASRDPRVSFVVQVSGPVVSPYEADTFAVMNRWRAAGLDDRERAEAVRLWRQEVGVIRRPDDASGWDRYREAVHAAEKTAWYARSGYAPSTPADWFTAWYRLVADFDPIPHLEKLRAPVLWIYGELDSQSDVPRNVELIERIRKSAPVRFDVAKIARSGHGILAPVDSLGRALGPLSTPPEFFEALESWLKRIEKAPAASG